MGPAVLRVSIADFNAWIIHQTQPENFVPCSQLGAPGARLRRWLDRPDMVLATAGYETPPPTGAQPRIPAELPEADNENVPQPESEQQAELQADSEPEADSGPGADTETETEIETAPEPGAESDSEAPALLIRLFHDSEVDPLYPQSIYEFPPALRKYVIKSFEFAGRFVGLCLWRKQVISVRFAHAFLKQVCLQLLPIPL